MRCEQCYKDHEELVAKIMKRRTYTTVVKESSSRYGGYVASIPAFGRWCCYAEGRTPEKSLQRLQDMKEEDLYSLLMEGLAVPPSQ